MSKLLWIILLLGPSLRAATFENALFQRVTPQAILEDENGDCKKGEAICVYSCFTFSEKKISEFCMQENQVYVEAHFKIRDQGKSAELFFDKPGDLGSGGASLPWEQFDSSKPLATLDLSAVDKTGQAQLKWNGFTLKNGKSFPSPYGKDWEGTYKVSRKN